MSEDVKKYYRERVAKTERNNFLWQVGKTVDGQEIGPDQVELILNNITANLQLVKDDVVLDVGCGNGLLTKKISESVSSVTGIELTSELCEIAKEYNASKNITYIYGDIIKIDDIGKDEKYTKIYLYEVMQHFDYPEADKLFNKLDQFAAEGARIFIGGVLDTERMWDYFNTEERRRLYFDGLLSGDNPLGCWYHQEFFSHIAKKHNFQSVCVPQDIQLYTSHYRFDCLLSRK